MFQALNIVCWPESYGDNGGVDKYIAECFEMGVQVEGRTESEAYLQLFENLVLQFNERFRMDLELGVI